MGADAVRQRLVRGHTYGVPDDEVFDAADEPARHPPGRFKGRGSGQREPRSDAMSNDDLTTARKAGFAAACAVCCAAPVLVVAGVVSVATLAVAGASAASITLVVGGAVLFWRHRLPHARRTHRLVLAVTGVATAAAGIVSDGAASRSAVVAGVAFLAAAALLALDDARSQRSRQGPAGVTATCVAPPRRSRPSAPDHDTV